MPSADFGEIAVRESLLHLLHLAPVDALGARVVAVRQTWPSLPPAARSDARGADTRWSRSPGPCRRKKSITFLALSLFGRVLHQTDHIRKHHRAFARNDEFEVALLVIFRAIGVEVVVEQDRHFAGDNARIRGLLRYDRLVLLQFLEESRQPERSLCIVPPSAWLTATAPT